MGTYRGTISNDTITPDTLSPGVTADPAGTKPSAASDIISGMDGNDVLNGLGGADTISGGNGNDDVYMHLLEDYEEVTLSGNANLYGGGGNDHLWSSYDGPLIDLSAATYVFFGEAGDDTLEATYHYKTENNDYGAATDILYGGTGNDSYVLGESTDTVIENPGEGFDSVVGYADDYILAANVEMLQLMNWSDGPTFGMRGTGNSSDNVLMGGVAEDTLLGMSGNDTIYGQGGDDTVYGGRSLDDPTDGPDRIYGDAGNDQVWAGGGDDTVYGGAGNEIHLSGQSGNDTLYGDAGTDYLAGGSGNDILYGGTENDRLSGTDGLDRLFGQGGTDTFDYDAVSHSRVGTTVRDVVGDFTGVGGSTRTEAIDLSTIDANTGATGNQAFTFRGTSAFSAPGQIRVQASGTSDTLIQANVTGTSGAEMEILVTDGAALPTSWNALDFLL
ncbi:MAG: calcium-binding protein [Rhodospirillales bacterium]|nr:calcium-binding protein [Rhodospirillales bacterium]